MAQPGRAPKADVYPVNVHWTQKKGWWITPDSSKVPLKQTVQFTTDKDCTICFDPQDKVFGASLDVDTGSSVDVPVGAADFSVNLCATVQGQTCNPARPVDAMGVIIVGSGQEGRK